MMKKILAPVVAVAVLASVAAPAFAASHVRHMHVMLPNGQTWDNVTDKPGHPWTSDFRVRRYLHGRPAHLVYDRKHDMYRVVLNSPHMTTTHVYHGYRQTHYAHHRPVHHVMHHQPMHHATVRKTTTVRTTTTTTVTPAMGQ